ncbi:MAG: oligosaccharide repeat unit polymerase [Lachnospiraceae bacterium]|nr:oligosaccharide repeat unit polymerase [Lachnospiraceae bacterium]
MIIYCVCYLTSFLLAQAGWDIPSGLMLIGAAMYVYWKDWRKTGNLIHLRGLFFLGFVGGQGISCFKLSRLQTEWSARTWLCFLAAALAFYGAFSFTESRSPGRWDAGGIARRVKKDPAGQTLRESGMNMREKRVIADSGGLMAAILGITAVSAAAFILEAAVLGYVPLFVRGIPHAYSYFHISGVHYFTVSCVLVPPLTVLFYLGNPRASHMEKAGAAAAAAVSLAIPILCVSRFQLIFAVGLSVLSYISVKRRINLKVIFGLGLAMIPLYIILTIARSHDVAYLNGIFEMKNSATPIFITQPYMYIANNYDNFNRLVEDLPSYSMGLRMLFPVWALTGMKFFYPSLTAFPIYVTKEELTTVTLLYDAYYDFGIAGVVGFAALLGLICGYLVKKLKHMQNPAEYLLYAQIAMYMALSFFTTWFSNPATWFYLAATGAVWVLCEAVHRG